MRLTYRSAALAALATTTLCCVPGAAHAAVTGSQITSPTGDFKSLTVRGDASTLTAAVTGTAAAADGDKVDLYCYGSGTYEPLASDLVVTGGTFSGSLDLTTIDDQQLPCTARAVPDGSATPSDISRLGGPRMFVSHFEPPATMGTTNVNGGGTASTNVYGAYTGARGVGYFYEPGDDPLYELGSVNPVTLYSTAYFGGYYMFDSVSDLVRNNSAGTGTSIAVDGHADYVASTIPVLNYDGVAGTELPTGVTSVGATASLDPATNTLTVVETYPVYRCADTGGAANDTIPVTTTTCPKTVSAGVTLVRTKKFTNDGASVSLEDAFTSTDGAAHAIRLEYADEANAYDYIETKGPGESAFSVRSYGDVLPYTSAPATLNLRDSEYTDSSYVGAGARTALEQPLKTVWDDDEDSYTSYDIPVPAGGVAKRTTVYSVAFTSADAEASANKVEDATGAPTIAIASPVAGSTTTSDTTLVAGTARDNKSVASVKVNGQSAAVASDGSFIVPLALKPGANPISAVVTDGAGNTNTATTSVTYVPPATPAQVQQTVVANTIKTCKIPVIKRGVTIAQAGASLKKAGCKVAVKRVSITAKTKKGRFLNTTPAAGTTILVDNAVRLTTSKGPKKVAKTKAVTKAPKQK